MGDIISKELETFYRPLADLGLDRRDSTGDRGSLDQTTRVCGRSDFYDGQ
jgi:hypothetical protein